MHNSSFASIPFIACQETETYLSQLYELPPAELPHAALHLSQTHTRCQILSEKDIIRFGGGLSLTW